MKSARKLITLLTILFTVAMVAPLRAAADDDDPPSRVARLGYLHGSVSFQPAGTDDWVNAVLNRPMTTGDKLWADNGARAEMHIGSASLRIAGNTGFSFLNLADNITQIRLTAGMLRIRVKRLEENETFEVDTPNLAFSVLRPGVYRINVNENGDSTIIKVRDGQGEITGGGAAYNIHAHEMGTFNGTDSLTADLDNYGNFDDDDFDQWCADRDRHEDLAISSRYVSPDVIGYEDLDEYGGWRQVPEYGAVWFPHTTIVGWAPYRYGHWAYIYPWGYTWIDDAPWGFAPFHYGRWVYVGGFWGWVPAPPPTPRVVYVRPVYAPALVAWVGGPHFAVGLSVGWFPLAPREVYVPSYHVSRTYINNVNISNTTVNTTVINNYYNNTVINRNTTVVNNNVTVVNQRYINQSVPGAVTATTHQAFTSAQPVGRNVVGVNAREVVSAPVAQSAPAVAPSRQAVFGAAATASVKPPVMFQNRQVVARVTPPPPPVSFARQQQAIQANGGNPPPISQIRQLQPDAEMRHPNVRIAPTATAQNIPAKPSGNSPGNPQGNTGNKPGLPAGGSGQFTPANRGNNQRTYDDRPPSSRPNGANTSAINRNSNNTAVVNRNVSPELDTKHQQQLEQLHTRQDAERQKVEQKQLQEQQKLAQQNATEQRQTQLNQKQQQQLEHLEQKHDTEMQKLKDKQQQERQKRPAESRSRETGR